MPAIKRLVLDVLKPHDPKIVEFTQQVGEEPSVEGVTSKLVDIEEEVRTLRVSVEGEDLDMDALEDRITDLSGSIHSIDEVSCGETVVDDPWLLD